jgi:ATP-dependent Lhr-like helicase
MERPASAFSLLHPTLQEMLYKMKWTELRPIQKDAIFSLFSNDNHLIISANTAAGKTEAAFLPILSHMMNKKSVGLSAIYVGPLKALINDQFERLERLCELTAIPVFKWHGDVGGNKKLKFLKNPSGVLLITPESIESVFINHPDEARKIFQLVSFVVIDEMHSFIGTERGAHLLSLLARIIQKSKSKVRVVGLSATIGDIEQAKKWLLPRDPNSIISITDPSEQKEIQYLIRGYLLEPLTKKEKNEVDAEETTLLEDIIRYFNGKTALIYVNSRTLLERYTDSVHRYLEKKGIPDNFRIHHGSLSTGEREETEKALKSAQPTATFCSSTLEMGIDVGNISRVGQIGAPWSVNSLAQRLGRSGRKEGQPSVMIMFIQENVPDQSDIIKRLHPDLIRAIAMSELMLEKWCEPPRGDLIHYSTLVQQTMSVITEKGGSTAHELYEILVERGGFHNVSISNYIQLLQSMGDADLIEQDKTGVLFLGLEGEKIVRNLEFYAAFVSNKEFDVISRGKKVGSIEIAPDLETRQFLILAGKRWEIKEVDYKKWKIFVEPSKGGKVPIFSGGSGPDIHPRIRQKMREVLISDQIPAYLDTKAREILKSAQVAAKEAFLHQGNFLEDHGYTYWFPWTGSAKQRTLSIIGREFFRFEIEDEGIALRFHNANPSQIKEAYKTILQNPPHDIELAERFQNLLEEKYDSYLPKDLLIESYAKKYIDTNISIDEIGLND